MKWPMPFRATLKELINNRMKEVMLSIEDKNYEAFINFVKTLDYVKVTDDLTIEGLKRSLEEAKSMEEGDSKKSVKKFLKGL